MTPANENPSPFSPRHPSGIDIIDDTWGGLYRGGAYLVYGRSMSGRGLLALMIARKGAALGERTLFVSSDRQKDLFIQAASLGFDLRDAHQGGRIRLIRVPTLTEIRYESDDDVAASLSDLADIIARQRSSRVVLNDFIPFIAFRSFQRFQFEFVQFLEKIDSLDATIVLVMPEPANAQSRRVIEFMGLQMTGSVHIELAEENPRSTRRRLTLIPHIGHIRHHVVDYWDLEDVVDDSTSTLSAVEQLEASARESFAAVDDLSGAQDKESIDTAVDADRDTAPAPDRGGPSTFEAPPAPLAAPTLGIPPAPPVTGPAEVADYADRSAFEHLLASLFAERDSGDNPFLILAMRMDRGGNRSVRPFDFDFLMDLVQDAIRPGDGLYIEPEDERLIVCLTGSTAADAQNFFARLKRTLSEESPLQADHLLHNVSAIVVPNGRPFLTVEEFMKYALNES